MYDFDTIIDRTGTGSLKWELRPEAVKQAGAVPLSVADMEFGCPPEVREALCRAAQHGICGYTIADDAYFEALSGFLKRRHGCEIEKDWLLVTNGVVSAINVAIRALSAPGDAVLIQPPVYAPFLEAIEQNGRKPAMNQLILREGRYEIDFADFERQCAKEETRLFILCSPHNPVGRVWTRAELERMADICLAHGVRILSDEIHADIVFTGRRHTSLLNLPAARENAVVCTAMSKTFNLAGLSCSDILIPDAELRRRFEAQQHIDQAFGMTYFARVASIAAHTQCDAWLDELNAYLEENYAFFETFFRERLPLLPCIKIEGTYLAWVDMRALGLSDAQMRGFCAKRAGLALNMGDWFGMGGSGFTRWNLALPRAALAELLERFALAVDAHIRGWNK